MFRDMENVKKYNVIFMEVFSVGEEVLNDEAPCFCTKQDRL